MQQQPDLISMDDLADSSSQPLPDVTAAAPLPGKLPALPPAGPGTVEQPLAAAQQQGAAAAAGSSALTGGLAYLQQSYLPTLSSGVTTALSTLRGRLGLPATASAAALVAQQAAAGIAEEHDEGLLQLGERALAEAGGAAAAAAAPDVRQLVAAARQWLATCSAEQLRLGDLPALMADYRRLARLGWSVLLRCVAGGWCGAAPPCRGDLWGSRGWLIADCTGGWRWPPRGCLSIEPPAPGCAPL